MYMHVDVNTHAQAHKCSQNDTYKHTHTTAHTLIHRYTHPDDTLMQNQRRGDDDGSAEDYDADRDALHLVERKAWP